MIVELGTNRVIPPEFAARIEGMAGFRNILVHRYLGVDPELVWDVLKNFLSRFF